MKHRGIECPECGAIIYSRARHDMHYCPCKSVYVNGGFDYLRYGHRDGIEPKIVELNLKQTRNQLFEDWNTRKNKFGTILKK